MSEENFDRGLDDDLDPEYDLQNLLKDGELGKYVARYRPLPSEFAAYFWDVDFVILSWQAHRDFIIRRVLQVGGLEALRWVLDTLGEDGLRQWIMRQHGKGLTPRQLCFWEAILDLPHEAVTPWVRAAQESVWGQRWMR